ncbi:MAG: Ig domain-containing protein, partial [Bacteroidetes bacterium]|nr:Ig domain-containing protein [Bacteroidota bacterium]
MKTKLRLMKVLLLFSSVVIVSSCEKESNPKRNLRILPDQVITANIDNTGYLNFNAQTILADGGNPLHNYNWSIESSPTPPSGVTIEPLTGVINRIGTSSTGLSVGDKTFKLKVSDGSSTKTETVTLRITAYTPGPAAVLQQWQGDFHMKDGYANKPYGASLFVMGGTPPYSWKLDDSFSESGKFTMSGLSIGATTGIVYGTISNSLAGQYVIFKVIVTDAT